MSADPPYGPTMYSGVQTHGLGFSRARQVSLTKPTASAVLPSTKLSVEPQWHASLSHVTSADANTRYSALELLGTPLPIMALRTTLRISDVVRSVPKGKATLTVEPMVILLVRRTLLAFLYVLWMFSHDEPDTSDKKLVTTVRVAARPEDVQLPYQIRWTVGVAGQISRMTRCFVRGNGAPRTTQA